jgi:ketosteroid isomerase-like protein
VSRENVELLRLANRLINAGDVGGAIELFHPDVEWRDLQHAPDTPEVVHGRAAIGALWTAWTEAFDDLRAEIAAYTDADPWVVCDTRWYGRGKGSSLAIDVRSADAYEVKDGKVVRIVVGYANRDDALEGLARGIGNV